MPKVTYIQPGGGATTLDLAAGTSVMQGAVQRGVPGILAECGGGCACATCHVYLDASWFESLPAAGDIETEMLTAVTAERRGSSRLSCQIVVTDALDGLVVHLPEAQ